MSGSGFGGPGRSPAGGEDGGASAYQQPSGALSVYGGGGGGGGAAGGGGGGGDMGGMGGGGDDGDDGVDFEVPWDIASMQPYGDLRRPRIGLYMYGGGSLAAIEAKRLRDPNWYHHVFTEAGLDIMAEAIRKGGFYKCLRYLEERGCIILYTGKHRLYRAMGQNSPRFDSTSDVYGGIGADWPVASSPTGEGRDMDLFVDMALHLSDKGNEQLKLCKSFTTDSEVAKMFSNSRRGEVMYESPHSTDILEYVPCEKEDLEEPPFLIDWRATPRTKLFADESICPYAVQNREVLVVGGAPVRDIRVVERGVRKLYRGRQ